MGDGDLVVVFRLGLLVDTAARRMVFLEAAGLVAAAFFPGFGGALGSEDFVVFLCLWLEMGFCSFLEADSFLSLDSVSGSSRSRPNSAERSAPPRTLSLLAGVLLAGVAGAAVTFAINSC